jgi:hypothetical protein
MKKKLFKMMSIILFTICLIFYILPIVAYFTIKAGHVDGGLSILSGMLPVFILQLILYYFYEKIKKKINEL